MPKLANFVGWLLAAAAVGTALSGFGTDGGSPCRIEWYSQPCPPSSSPKMIAGSEKYWCVAEDGLCCAALCYPYRCVYPDGNDAGEGGCAVFAVNGTGNVVCPAPASCDCYDLTEYGCVPPPAARVGQE